MAIAMPTTPVLTFTERSALLSATMTPDSASGGIVAADFGAFLYRINGRTSVQTLVAALDNTLASATDWAAFTPKTMSIVDGIVFESGDTLALKTQYAGSTASWLGALTLKFRRVD